MTPIQCKMARTALGWAVRDLARESSIGTTTINRLEAGNSASSVTIEALTKAFEKHGLKLISPNEPSPKGGPGVRWMT